jgi:hypothetical protein
MSVLAKDWFNFVAFFPSLQGWYKGAQPYGSK